MAPPVKKETPLERKERRKQRKLQKFRKRVLIHQAKWDPKKIDNSEVTKDAYKTLFVGRLAYDITEDDLKHEFEHYGTVVKVHIVRDKKTEKPRGYAFVEFAKSQDLKEAFKDADGRKINGRRIVVDVERGRTVKNWLPRRLGGGLGGTRIGNKDQNQKYSGRDLSVVRSSDDRRSRSRSRSRSRDRRKSRSPEKDRHKDRERDRDRDRERDRDRDRERERDKDRDKDRHKHRERRARSRSP